MMNWCSRHDCFEICPECMRERRARIHPEPAMTDPRTSDERARELAEQAAMHIRTALMLGQSVTVNVIPPVYDTDMTIRSCLFINGLYAGKTQP